MLRALIVGVLVVSVAAACSKSKSDTPTVAVAAAAGKVVEISGKVTATREGATRDLAIGNEVFADDHVETAADATVTIELFHNNARWSVVSERKQRVDSSIAWGLEKQQATKPVEHNSAAAGREGERSAADTSATARAIEAAPATEVQIRTRGEPVGGGAPGASPPPPPPAVPQPAPRSTVEPPTPRGGAGGKAGAGQAAPLADGVEREKTPLAGVPAQLLAKRADFEKCLSPQGRDVKITVTVKQGKATFVLGGTGNRTDVVRSCIELVVKSIDFAGDGTGVLEFR